MKLFGPRKMESNTPLPRIERALKRYFEAAEQLEDVRRNYNKEISALRSELRTASAVIRPLKNPVEHGFLEDGHEEPSPLWDSELTAHRIPDDTKLVSRNLAILKARLNHLSLLKERLEATCNEELSSISRCSTDLTSLHDAVLSEEDPFWARKNVEPIAFSAFVGSGTTFVLLYQTTRSSGLALGWGAVMGIACASFKLLKSLNRRRDMFSMIWDYERKAIWLSQGFDVCYPVLSTAVRDALENCRKGVKELSENRIFQEKKCLAEERPADTISAKPQAS